MKMFCVGPTSVLTEVLSVEWGEVRVVDTCTEGSSGTSSVSTSVTSVRRGPVCLWKRRLGERPREGTP